MKITQEIVDTVWKRLQPGPFVSTIRPALEEALRDVPDVQPFRFAGYPDSETFIHPTCGTVVDVAPGSDTWDQVQVGECDCENTGPWARIYVEVQP